MLIDLRHEVAVVVRVVAIGWGLFKFFDLRDAIGSPRALGVAFMIIAAALFASWLIDDRNAGDYWPIEDWI